MDGLSERHLDFILERGLGALAEQRDHLEAELTRVTDLLRLTTTTIGFVVLTAGVVATAELEPGPIATLLGLSGLVALVIAVFLYTLALSSDRSERHLALGPDLRDQIEMAADARFGTQHSKLIVASALPTWLDKAGDALGAHERVRRRGTSMLWSGLGLLCIATIYMAGGRVLG